MGDEELVVVSWNLRVAWTPALRHCWWARRPGVREVLERPAHLIGVQEIQSPHRRLLARLPGRSMASAGQRAA